MKLAARLSFPLQRVLKVMALLALTLASCAPVTLQTQTQTQPAYTGELTPRPAGSPDVLLLSVAGRCPAPCRSPGDNLDYLTPRGTVQAVASVLEARGLSVQGYGVAAALTTHQPKRVVQAQIGAGKTVSATQDGFVQLEEHLLAADRDWIRGRSNPTRIVLLAHSHGVVWTHALARAHPEVPIAVMIDLDGICDFWESDNRRSIQDYVRGQGHTPWTFDLADSCGSVRVGHLRYDLKDVVYPNVAVGLEVQSQRLLSRQDGSFVANLPFDSLQNIRPDGSRTGLSMYRAPGETHSRISYPASRAVTWVTAQLNDLSTAWVPGQTPFAAPQPADPVSATPAPSLP